MCRISVPSTFRHSRMKAARPVQPFRDRCAVDMRVLGPDVDVDAADRGHLGGAGAEAGDLAALQDAGYRHQDLDAVADREDWLLRLVEVPHDRLDARIGADVFGPRPPAQ